MTEKTVKNISSIKQKQQPEALVLKKRKQEIEKMFLSQGVELAPVIFTLATVAILYAGWSSDLDNYITAESGLGYFLGIIGSAMMFITLLYSLRKRLKSMRNWGNIRTWFTVHMVLGIYGPVLILYHCNFSIGASQNEKVAVISMLIVVVSGIVGRYVHDKIRYGLCRHEATLEQLQFDKFITENELSNLHQSNPALFNDILSYNKNIKLNSAGLIKSLFRMLSLNTATRVSSAIAKSKFKMACKQLADKEQWNSEKYKMTLSKVNIFLSAHYSTVRKIASFSFYERVFSIWFFLHIPLFYMLIVSVIFHIIAVHMFSAHPY